MAIQPSDYTINDRLQPGARGQIFQASQPGYRDGADRVNRTQAHLNVSQHDTPNIKYAWDFRLPVLFKYGFAYGFNQVVVPKGRIMAVDKNLQIRDFEMQKRHNVLTLANGGAPVKIREATDKYETFTPSAATDIISPSAQGQPMTHPGKEFTTCAAKTYTADCYRAFAPAGTYAHPDAQLDTAGFEVDAKTGRVVDKVTKANKDNVRAGNVPVGMLERNEYTRDEDAYNGIAPGPVLTDALVELPWFAFKDKAESNFWGSAYGNLFPGALVKSDENGRVVLSPLSSKKAMDDMKLPEYELERQQVIGQVYAVNHELVPEGAAKWATWALEDRLKSEEFNPAVYAKTNRRGEDTTSTSPYHTDGTYPGYPYDKNYLNHDLHMLASTARLDSFDPRMNAEFQYNDLGIPGLTDGYNAVVEQKPDFKAGVIHYAGGKDYVEMFFRNLDINVEDLQISIDGVAFAPCVAGAKLNTDTFQVKYANPQQGIVVIDVIDKTKADTLLSGKAEKQVDVVFRYKKRGRAGVPTFMDWDGVVGSVRILLTK